MSLELWNTVATFGTLVVISATGIAALVQLRHMRGSNQITALSDLFAKRETAEFVAASHFVFAELPRKMQDPAFRAQIRNRAGRTEENALLISKILTVGSYFEEMGLLVKADLVDGDLVCDMHCTNILAAWHALEEPLAELRTESVIWGENFEYLTVLAEDWIAQHPSGSYPKNVRRIGISSRWQRPEERPSLLLGGSREQ